MRSAVGESRRIHPDLPASGSWPGYGYGGRTGRRTWVRFFYDCEFIEDGRTIELVSIGVVDESGREFYAVSTEFDPSRAIDWVRRHGLDKLPPPADAAWRPLAPIRSDLLAFLLPPGEP